MEARTEENLELLLEQFDDLRKKLAHVYSSKRDMGDADSNLETMMMYSWFIRRHLLVSKLLMARLLEMLGCSPDYGRDDDNLEFVVPAYFTKAKLVKAVDAFLAKHLSTPLPDVDVKAKARLEKVPCVLLISQLHTPPSLVSSSTANF